jgi:hypothetical protein
VDYFFYITDNGDLNVQTFGGGQSYTLAVNVRWVDVIPASDRIHVYFSDRTTSMVLYLAFEHFGAGSLTPTSTSINGAFLTFSVNYAANSTPPAYLLLLNDGVNHNLYVATDPTFQTILASRRVYSNIVDLVHYTTQPTISMHPEDTDVATINVQQIRLSDGHSKVGFYVVKIPGVA